VLAPGEDPQAVLDAFIANYPDYATDEKVAELKKTLKLDSGDTSSKNDDKKDDNKNTSSKSSAASTGTTETGDATPFVALAVLLVAALGVAVIASKKKVTE